MTRVRTFMFVSMSLGLAFPLGSPSAAQGQMVYAFAGGLNVARTVPGPYPPFPAHTANGFALQASVGRRLAGRWTWRLDVFASQFQLTQPSDFAGVMCVFNPPPGTCCGICPRGTTTGVVGVAGLAPSGLVSLTRAASGFGMYLFAGPETAYWYQHPDVRGALRFGGSSGVGLTVPVGGRIQAVVEARYHALIDAPSQPTWFLPVTFGLRF